MLKILLVLIGICTIAYFIMELIITYSEYYDKIFHRVQQILSYIISVSSALIPLFYKDEIVFILSLILTIYWLAKSINDRKIFYYFKDIDSEEDEEEEESNK